MWLINIQIGKPNTQKILQVKFTPSVYKFKKLHEHVSRHIFRYIWKRETKELHVWNRKILFCVTDDGFSKLLVSDLFIRQLIMNVINDFKMSLNIDLTIIWADGGGVKILFLFYVWICLILRLKRSLKMQRESFVGIFFNTLWMMVDCEW